MTTPTVGTASRLTPRMADVTIGSPKLEATWIVIASPDETPTAEVIRSCIAAVSLPAKAPPLSEKYDFGKNLQIAEIRILKGKTEEARSKFQEVFARLQESGLPETFYPVRCHSGLASCCPPGNDRRRHALDAYSALQRLFAYEATMKGAYASPFYSQLRWHLKKLWLLMVGEQTGELVKIEDKIRECGRHILPIDTFDERVREGHELRTAGLKICREVFEQALALIHEENGIEFQVARIKCLISLTSCYKKNPHKLVTSCARLQTALFKLYDQRAFLYEAAEIQAYTALPGFLKILIDLTPQSDIQNRKEIQRRMNLCELEIKRPYKVITRGSAVFSTAAPRPEPIHRKMTLIAPNVHNRLGRFFVAVSIVLIAVMSMALYQTHTVTDSK